MKPVKVSYVMSMLEQTLPNTCTLYTCLLSGEVPAATNGAFVLAGEEVCSWRLWTGGPPGFVSSFLREGGWIGKTKGIFSTSLHYIVDYVQC